MIKGEYGLQARLGQVGRRALERSSDAAQALVQVGQLAARPRVQQPGELGGPGLAVRHQRLAPAAGRERGGRRARAASLGTRGSAG